MKKLLLSIVLAAAALGITSCKKSWTCVCTTTTNYNGQIETSTESIELTTYHKGLAKTTCSANATSSSSSGYSTTTTCDLK